MRAQKTQAFGQNELFRSRLENIIAHNHELVVLTEKINWNSLEEKFGKYYDERNGRPSLTSRLMAGLHYLKYLYNESDENAVKKFIENPYWQYFCGNEFFEHELPCHPTSLVKWRKRVGAKGAEKMLIETITAARNDGLLTDTDLKDVIIDTTVQPKNIAYPADAALMNTVRRALVRLSEQEGIKLRQAYTRLGPKALKLHSRLRHRKEVKLAKKQLRKLRTYLGRIIRDIQRKVGEPSSKLAHMLQMGLRILGQKKNSKNKIYSVHAPEVECIAKGKSHKKYEFGSKVSVATTNKSNWVVGAHSFAGNPFDGHTISDALLQIKALTGQFPTNAYCDRGYRGSEGHVLGTHVFLDQTKQDINDVLRKKLRRRSAIEPVIGHIKNDHRMDRNFLLGFEGDQINALMAACAFNLRKLMRELSFGKNLARFLSFFRSYIALFAGKTQYAAA
jgi:IS5 family transposase